MAASVPTQSATLAAVATSTTVATLLGAGARRSMVIIVNDSAGNLFVKFGAAASATDYTVKIATQGYYEVPTPAYGGAITGILDSGTGTGRVTSY